MALEQNLFLLDKAEKKGPSLPRSRFCLVTQNFFTSLSWKGALRDGTITTEWETGQANLTRSCSQSEYGIRSIIPAVAQPAA